MFLEFALSQLEEIGEIERSGSCAIIALVVDEICYIANTGDSRAVMSVSGGKQVLTLSNDHKPTDKIEVERILKFGG
jgi:serine/threonine protein phosphatase PrpC